MGGDDDAEDPNEAGAIKDLGSVGDWRMPSWVTRLPAVAWVFVALTMADIVVEFVLRAARLDSPDWPDLGVALGSVARALPILVPGALVARAGRSQLPLRDPLFAGAMAIALGIILGTTATVIREQFYTLVDAQPGDVAHDVAVATLRVLATIFGFVGPILLASAVLRHRRGRAPRWAIWAAVASFALAGVQIVYTVGASFVALALFPSLLDDLGSQWIFDAVLGTAGSFTLLSWAYLAWAVVSAAGDATRPRFAWVAGLGSMVARQVGAVILLVETAVSYIHLTNWSTGDTTVQLILALLGLLSVLYAVSSVLFTVAFAAGLGSPGPVEPEDAERLELDPLPSPG